MKFYADHHFHIGHMHTMTGRPCQDYALSYSDDESATAIVSDGCSSGGDTDVGARIVALATKMALRHCPRDFAEFRRRSIEDSSQTLGLLPEDVLATSVYAQIGSQGCIIHIEGDGVVAIKYRSGGIEVRRYDWAANAPYYPTYGTEEVSRYLAQIHGGNADAAFLKCTYSIILPEGGGVQDTTSFLPIEVAMHGVAVSLTDQDLAAVEYIALFSDGICQIDQINWHRAVVEFMGFKTHHGEFAKRRMARGIRDSMKIGQGPQDDLSYAVIRIEHES